MSEKQIESFLESLDPNSEEHKEIISHQISREDYTLFGNDFFDDDFDDYNEKIDKENNMAYWTEKYVCNPS